jgi:transcriptional regulator with XRE-family HTH domain
MTTRTQAFGPLLRTWRQRRRLSQLDLALEAEVSQRHLSFIESGRAEPSRDMVLHLAEQLDVPLRERNTLLLAAGYAPFFHERPLDHPAMAPVRDAVRQVLAAHLPFPALAYDRNWCLVEANPALAPLLAGCAPALLAPPVNLVRLSLHPKGVAPRILNLGEWRAHLLARLRRQLANTGDATLGTLLAEVAAYPAPEAEEADANAVAIPLRLAVPGGVLSFLSTTTVFGTPQEVTLAELAIEAFLPADAATAAALKRQAAGGP